MNKTTLALSIATAFFLTACGGGSSTKTEPVTKVTTPETQVTDSNLAVGVLNMSENDLDFELNLSKTQSSQITKIEKKVFGVEPFLDNNDLFELRTDQSLKFTISTPGKNQLEIVSKDSNTKESVSDKVDREFQSAIEESTQYVLVAYTDLNSEQQSSEIKTDFIKLNNSLNEEKSIEIDIFNFTKLNNISYRVNCSNGNSTDVEVDNEKPYETIACSSGQDLVSASVLSDESMLTLEYSFISGEKYFLIIGQNTQGQIISQLVNKESF